jgi:hypothetical protein
MVWEGVNDHLFDDVSADRRRQRRIRLFWLGVEGEKSLD